MDGAGTSRTTAIAHLGPSRLPAGSVWSFTRMTSCARAMAGARAKHNNKHAPFCNDLHATLLLSPCCVPILHSASRFSFFFFFL